MANQSIFISTIHTWIKGLKSKKSDVSAFLYKNEKGKIVPLDDVNLDIMKNMLIDATVSDSALSTKLNLSDLMRKLNAEGK